MSLYEHCTQSTQKSENIYMVAFVNWKGEWCMDSKEFKSKKSAQAHSKKIAKKKALNGRVSVRSMPKSKTERNKLQASINEF